MLWEFDENGDSLKEEGINITTEELLNSGEEGEIMEEEDSKVKDETVKMDYVGLT